MKGVYKYLNTVNGMVYIGSTKDFRTRKNKLIAALRHGILRNHKLQSAFNEFGESAFQFSIIEVVEDESNLRIREQHHLDILFNHLSKLSYNIAKSAFDCAGIKKSAEFCKNISRIHKGKLVSEETRERHRIAMNNRPEELKQKFRNINVGRKHKRSECPHCKKVGGGARMNHFHFDNCKMKVA